MSVVFFLWINKRWTVVNSSLSFFLFACRQSSIKLLKSNQTGAENQLSPFKWDSRTCTLKTLVKPFTMQICGSFSKIFFASFCVCYYMPLYVVSFLFTFYLSVLRLICSGQPIDCEAVNNSVRFSFVKATMSLSLFGSRIQWKYSQKCALERDLVNFQEVIKLISSKMGFQ